MNHFMKGSFIKNENNGYFAKLIALVSLITVILICPG